MSGPATKPGDLNSPIAGAQSAQTAAQAPEMPQQPNPQPNASPSPSPSPDEALSMMEGNGEPPAQTPSSLHPDDALALMDQVDGGSATPGAPANRPGFASALLGATPLGTMLRMMTPEGEAPPTAQILSKFSKNPEGQRQIFQSQAGAGYETRVMDKEVEFRPAGGGEWKKVDPKLFDSFHGFVTRLADLIPDVAEGMVQGAATAGGLALGAAGGAVAGVPAAGVGAVPVAVSGGLAGAAAAGAAGGVAAGIGREAISRLLGADPDPNLTTELAWSAGIGGVAPVAGAALRKPAEKAAAWLINQGKSGTAVVGKEVSGLMKQFGELYESVAGKSLAKDVEGKLISPTLGQAGQLAGSAIEGAEKRLGDNIGALWSQVEKTHPDTVFLAQGFTKELEQTLKEGYRFQEVPRVTLGEAVKYKAVANADADAGLAPLAKMWNKLAEDGGYKISELKDLTKKVQFMANYETAAPTAVERTYRALYSALRTDRDGILLQATKGTEAEHLAQNAFSEYAGNIDMLRKLSREAEKSPEKFAAAYLKDAQTAQAVKSTLANPDHAAIDGMNGWDALRSAWMNKGMEAAKDAKTGIVDIPKFFNTLNRNPDLAKVVVGEDAMMQLKGLSTAMEKTNWQGLLANPDSTQGSGILRALTKFFLSHGNPAYGANLAGAILAYEPKYLKLLQEKGIAKFAQEATTMQERSYWMRSGRMINRLLDGTMVSPLGGPEGVKIPLENSVISSLLNAGVRPANEPTAVQQAHAQSSYQLYLEKQHEIAQENARKLAEASKVQASPMPANPFVATQGSQQFFFSRGGRHGLHSGRHGRH